MAEMDDKMSKNFTIMFTELSKKIELIATTRQTLPQTVVNQPQAQAQV